jgi:hypothetical protein
MTEKNLTGDGELLESTRSSTWQKDANRASFKAKYRTAELNGIGKELSNKNRKWAVPKKLDFLRRSLTYQMRSLR